MYLHTDYHFNHMWTIVTKNDVAEYARINISNIDDSWYDIVLGIVENKTGWFSLENAVDVTETVHGNNSPIMVVKAPINSITSIVANNSIISPSTYTFTWNKIYMKNKTDRSTLSVFPPGIANIDITYNVGGTDSLPPDYQENLRATLLLCLKEFVAVPRNEGSDQMLKKYRPDRTMMPEEVLQSYGLHGKISGIIKSLLPNGIRIV